MDLLETFFSHSWESSSLQAVEPDCPGGTAGCIPSPSLPTALDDPLQPALVLGNGCNKPDGDRGGWMKLTLLTVSGCSWSIVCTWLLWCLYKSYLLWICCICAFLGNFLVFRFCSLCVSSPRLSCKCWCDYCGRPFMVIIIITVDWLLFIMLLYTF